MMHSLVRLGFFVAVSCAALALSSPRQALACSPVDNALHYIDENEAELDTTSPKPPLSVAAEVHRKDPENGCSYTANSCGDLAAIVIHVEPGLDDRTPEAELGYVFELVDGKLPDDRFLPEMPVRPSYGPLVFHYDDHGQRIDFTVAVRAMDLGGNLSEPVIVEVSDPGSGGCSAGAQSGSATMILVILAVLVGLRRRRDAFPA